MEKILLESETTHRPHEVRVWDSVRPGTDPVEACSARRAAWKRETIARGEDPLHAILERGAERRLVTEPQGDIEGGAALTHSRSATL